MLGEESDSVALADASYPRAERMHPPPSLMARGSYRDGVAEPRSSLPQGHVGGAYAAPFDAYHQLTGAWFWDGDFHQLRLGGAYDDCCTHGACHELASTGYPSSPKAF